MDAIMFVWSRFVDLLEWIVGVVDFLLVEFGVPVNLWTELSAIALIGLFAYLIFFLVSVTSDLVRVWARNRRAEEKLQVDARGVSVGKPSRLRRFLTFLGRTGSRAEVVSVKGIAFSHKTASALFGKVKELDERSLLFLGIAAFVALNVLLGLLIFARDVGMIALTVVGALIVAPPVIYVALWVTRGAGWTASRVFPRLSGLEESELELSTQSFVPVGLVTYHEVVEVGMTQVEKTGRDFRGFLIDLQTLVLLINGKGFWLEDPRRLRKHEGHLGDGEKKVKISYTELEIFRDLIGKPPGTRFSWRDSLYVLINFEVAETVVHGSHGHLRNVSMAPDGKEGVYLWLAEGIEVETERREGQDVEVDVTRTGEILLVEEAMRGGHQGILSAWAWTGEELDEEAIEEAREILANFGPDSIVPAPPAQLEVYQNA